MNRTPGILHPLSRTLLVAVFGLGLFTGAAPPAHAQTTDALLDTLQHTGVMYFWNEANPANGLIKDRSASNSACSIAAVGFGLSALCVGVDHGWLSRGDVAGRVLTTLNTFWTGPQSSASSGTIGYKGFFYHFLDMNTATRAGDTELSTIDTALLLAGIFDVRQYFHTNDPTDIQIRALADSIDRRVDWTFAKNSTAGILMGWKPNGGFNGYGIWSGYSEGLIIYIEALGSPTHPVSPLTYNGWTSGYGQDWQTWYGQTFLVCPPLFTHQYPQCWLDLRATQDAFMRVKNTTYYENTQRATIANRAYCIENPGGWTAYGDSLWGLTASDDPFGYDAHGAPPAQSDNGTISPTAAISSISFTPDLALPFIRNLWNTRRAQLWGPYGYVDAFNPELSWVDSDVLGIDQGPIVLSIENYRTGAVWARMANDPDMTAGLAAAGFQPHSTGVGGPGPGAAVALAIDPNPATTQATILCTQRRAGRLRVDVYDVRGRLVATPADLDHAAGAVRIELPVSTFAPGVYLVRVSTPEGTRGARLVKVR